MPILNQNPVVIPARPEIVADKIAVEKLTIQRVSDAVW